MSDLEKFLAGYTECALWSSTDESRPDGGDSLEGYDIAPETLAGMRTDGEDFMQANAADLEDLDADYAGHDFWLTRNGHGAGFWDGDYPKDIGYRLTEASHHYDKVNLYIGDDGLIYS